MNPRIIIPAYDPYPGPAWDVIFAHADDVWAVVLNVNSGVGTLDDFDAYTAMSKRLKAANILRLGYVSSRYGGRPIAEIKAEIALWFERYKVDGIFCDEMEHEGTGFLPYYKRIKSACGSAILVTNPGTVPDTAYADLDAIICVAETDQQTYLSKTFPPWTTMIGGRAVAHIVFGVTDAAKVLAKIDANQADYFYITSTVPKPGASGPEFNIPDTIWTEATPTTPPPTEDPNWSASALRLVSMALQAPANSTLADVPNLAAQRMLELVQLRAAQSGTFRLSAVPDDQIVEEVRRRLAQ